MKVKVEWTVTETTTYSATVDVGEVFGEADGARAQTEHDAGGDALAIVRGLVDEDDTLEDHLAGIESANARFTEFMYGATEREVAAITAVDYDHDARPDDMPEPGDRCKECGEGITWVGPSQYDWVHVGDPRNATRSGGDA